jgi:methylated-DNA-protein-cysteine methyltransferase-like protein
MMTEETARIIMLIQSIPEGKVSSYRDIARAAGLPNGARQVVRVLHSMSRKEHLPWHRVIRADGKIGLPEGNGREDQIILLRNEGVNVSDSGKVDMSNYSIHSFLCAVHEGVDDEKELPR